MLKFLGLFWDIVLSVVVLLLIIILFVRPESWRGKEKQEEES
jgi:hypothetical protein